MPVAAYAELDRAGELTLRGRVVSLGGERGSKARLTVRGWPTKPRRLEWARRWPRDSWTTERSRILSEIAAQRRAARARAVMLGTVVVTASPGTFPGLIERCARFRLAVEEWPLLTFAPPLDWGRSTTR